MKNMIANMQYQWLITQHELLVYWEGKQVDTCSQIKECTTNFDLSHCASNGRTTRILVLTGIRPGSSSLMFVVKKTFFGTFVFLFLVHLPLRNFAYDGTCWIASRSGTLIFTWLNISSIFSMCAFCLLFLSLLENGTIGLCTWSTDFLFQTCRNWREWN